MNLEPQSSDDIRGIPFVTYSYRQWWGVEPTMRIFLVPE